MADRRLLVLAAWLAAAALLLAPGLGGGARAAHAAEPEFPVGAPEAGPVDAITETRFESIWPTDVATPADGRASRAPAARLPRRLPAPLRAALTTEGTPR
jgi:hypothetical protein